MSVRSLTSVDDASAEAVVDHLRDGVSSVFAALKWGTVLTFTIGWTVFWSNVARINVALGDVVAAGLTAVVFVGGFLAAVLGAAASRFDRSVDVGL
jgi:hypothetical protein